MKTANVTTGGRLVQNISRVGRVPTVLIVIRTYLPHPLRLLSRRVNTHPYAAHDRVAWTAFGSCIVPSRRGTSFVYEEHTLTGACQTSPEFCMTECLRYAHCFLCTNTCTFGGDQECDDGGSGAEYAECPAGSDCDDCGVRGGHVHVTSTPKPPMPVISPTLVSPPPPLPRPPSPTWPITSPPPLSPSSAHSPFPPPAVHSAPRLPLQDNATLGQQHPHHGSGGVVAILLLFLLHHRSDCTWVQEAILLDVHVSQVPRRTKTVPLVSTAPMISSDYVHQQG